MIFCNERIMMPMRTAYFLFFVESANFAESFVRSLWNGPLEPGMSIFNSAIRIDKLRMKLPGGNAKPGKAQIGFGKNRRLAITGITAFGAGSAYEVVNTTHRREKLAIMIVTANINSHFVFFQ